jgi:hypothetical protein
MNKVIEIPRKAAYLRPKVVTQTVAPTDEMLTEVLLIAAQRRERFDALKAAVVNGTTSDIIRAAREYCGLEAEAKAA